MSRIPRFHLISNRELCPVRKFPEIATAAVRGGAGAIHVREPGLSSAELMELARRVIVALSGSAATILVNGDIEAAMRSGASGVHLAERQLELIPMAREQLPDNSLVGVSVHSRENAIQAELLGADYLIAGHVFETESKPGQSARGLEFVRHVCSAVSIPVVGIGGITPENAGEVLRAGAHGIAVLSGILAAEDPEIASRAYRRNLDCSEGGSSEG